MLYLLDANTVIDAKRDYYKFKRVPEFWEWLLYKAEHKEIKMPIETYEEIKRDPQDEKDEDKAFFEWFTHSETKKKLVLDEDVDRDLLNKVIQEGYGNNLNDNDIEKIGRDPFIIAYALASKEDRCVVTSESTKPSRQGANRKIPDVCEDLDVKCCDPFGFTEKLGFSTNWKDHIKS